MKNNRPPMVVKTRGITLIELTVVIVVLISLISVLGVGTKAWKRGGDRAACVMNMRNCQVATRSYQNLYGYYFGGRPQTQYGTQNIARHLVEKDYISRSLYGQIMGSKPCSGGGSYTTGAPDVFPMPGDLYMKCSLSESEEHMPENAADW